MSHRFLKTSCPAVHINRGQLVVGLIGSESYLIHSKGHHALLQNQVRPFIEAMFQRHVYATSVAAGPSPSWNEELCLQFRSKLITMSVVLGSRKCFTC